MTVRLFATSRMLRDTRLELAADPAEPARTTNQHAGTDTSSASEARLASMAGMLDGFGMRIRVPDSGMFTRRQSQGRSFSSFISGRNIETTNMATIRATIRIATGSMAAVIVRE